MVLCFYTNLLENTFVWRPAVSWGFRAFPRHPPLVQPTCTSIQATRTKSHCAMSVLQGSSGKLRGGGGGKYQQTCSEHTAALLPWSESSRYSRLHWLFKHKSMLDYRANPKFGEAIRKISKICTVFIPEALWLKNTGAYKIWHMLLCYEQKTHGCSMVNTYSTWCGSSVISGNSDSLAEV